MTGIILPSTEVWESTVTSYTFDITSAQKGIQQSVTWSMSVLFSSILNSNLADADFIDIVVEHP